MTKEIRIGKSPAKLLALIAIVLAVIFATAGVIAIGMRASAAEDPKLEIVASNVEYAESLHLHFGVEATLPENVEKTSVKLLVFTEAMSSLDEYKLENATEENSYTRKGKLGSVTVGSTSYEDIVLFDSKPIAAKEMTDDIYVVAYVEVASEVFYSDPLKYSVLQYMYDRADDKGVSAEQKALYERTLNYGASAQTVLGYNTSRLANAAYKQITLDGALFADGFKKGLFTVGETVEAFTELESAGENKVALLDPKNNEVAVVDGEGKLSFTVTESTASGTYTAALSKTPVALIGLTVEGKAGTELLLDPGSQVTLIADAAPAGYVQFHWDLAGEIIVPNTEPDGAFKCTYTVPASEREITLKAVYATDTDSVLAESFDGLTIASSGYFASGNSYTADKSLFSVVEIEDARYGGAKNNVIHLLDPGNGPSGGLYVYPTGFGNATVVEFDLLINEGSSDITNEIDIGSSYRLELYGADQVLYLKDRHNPTSEIALRNDLGVETYKGAWYSYRIEYYPVGVSGDTADSMIAVVYIDGEPVSISTSPYKYKSDEKVEAQPGNLRFWSMVSTKLDCYLDNLKCYRTNGLEMDDATVAKLTDKGAFRFSIPDSETAWKTRYGMLQRLFRDERFLVLGADGTIVGSYEKAEDKETYSARLTKAFLETWTERFTAELTALEANKGKSESEIEALVLERIDAEIDAIYASKTGNYVSDVLDKWSSELFGTEVYEWLAGLYDPKTGMFYYSESARDNYGFLPDVESTGQSDGVMAFFGGSLKSVLSDEQESKLGAYSQFLQSNEDGYFYHPQWGTDIGDSRRGRDLGGFISRINNFAGKDFIFTNAYKRLDPNDSSAYGSAEKLVYTPKTALTVRLGSSVTAMVSKVVLTADSSSLPEHLLSLENLNAYLENLWGGTYTAAIGHSYSFGNTVTSQNGQFKSAGPEYMNAVIAFLNARQEEAAEITRANARYIYELQREGAEFVYDGKDSEGNAYDFTDVDNSTVINGLWEAGGTYPVISEEEAERRPEEYAAYNRAKAFRESVATKIVCDDKTVIDAVTVPVYNYTFVSGLLKISGIYNALKAEMPFAAEALASAIEMMKDSALHYKQLRESVVSVYNPPNAIVNILGNINAYGDLEVRAAARKQLQDSALMIVENTMAKLEVYKCPDGGFSYSPSNSAQTSQGEPAACGNRKEGDVNGTALALGARRAMLSALGLANIIILPTHATDIDGDGIIGENETHVEAFKALINAQTVIEKNDNSVLGAGEYAFENGEIPNNTADEETNPHKVTLETVIGPDGNSTTAAYMKDNDSKTGLTVSFDSARVDGSETYYEFKADMKYGVTGHTQIYLSKLKLNISMGSVIELYATNSGDKQRNDGKTFGAVNGTEWFTLDAKVYPQGLTVEKYENGYVRYADGTVTNANGLIVNETPTGTFTEVVAFATASLTQNGKTYLEYYVDFAEGAWTPTEMSSARVYSLNGSLAGIYLDNVGCYQYGSISSGWYNFDEQKIIASPEYYGIKGGKILDDQHTAVTDLLGNKKFNKLLMIDGKATDSDTSVTLNAGTAGGDWDYNELQLSMYLCDTVSGTKTTLTLLDKSGKEILKLYVAVNYEDKTNATLTFYHELFVEPIFKISEVNLTAAVDLRFELHNYNSAKTARLDVIARFKGTDGLYDAKGMYLETDALVKAGADSTAFASVNIDVAGGQIYLDDVFVRNVLFSSHR